MPTLALPDGHLHHEVVGDGPDLLLVAGLGGRHEFWLEQVPALAKRFRVVLHDHRGTGRSSRSVVRYSVAQMAGDLLALMDALGIESADIVGHSTGGAIAQHIALDHPHRIRRMVLSASWAGPDPMFLRLFELRRRVLETCGPDAYLTEGTFLGHPGWWIAEHRDAVERSRAARLDAFPGAEIELSRIDAVMAHDLRARLPHIRTPTFVVAAEDDQITPPHLSRELADLIPGARLSLLPRGGHFCPVTVPADYGARLRSFLEAP